LDLFLELIAKCDGSLCIQTPFVMGRALFDPPFNAYLYYYNRYAFILGKKSSDEALVN
jgi:hypothetical protein